MKLPLTVDCHYVQSQFACSYLITEGKQAVFIETNTTHAVPRLLSALKARNLKPEQVKYIIITHVHLDHAGGSSALVQACPNATLLTHPRASQHVIDPTHLIESAKKVYGDEIFGNLYGRIEPIPAERVRTMEDGEVIPFHSRDFQFFYTRGHANHHFCIGDSESEGIFTGDSFGIAYPALQSRGLFIFPSTSPTQFDPAEARKSISKIVNRNPKRVFLTHFGGVKKVREAASQLLKHLDFAESLVEKAKGSDLPDAELPQFCERILENYFKDSLQKHGIHVYQSIWETIRMDIQLNAAGIAFLANKLRRPAT